MKSSLMIAAVTLMVGMPAYAIDFPSIKGGEWQMTSKMNMPGAPGGKPVETTTKICLKQKTSKDTEELFKQSQKKRPMECSDNHWNKVGNTIISDISCKDATIHVEITMNGDSAYRQEMKMHMQTPSGAREMSMVSDARWIGACPANEKAH